MALKIDGAAAPVEHLSAAAKHAFDVGAVGVAVGTLFNWLPGIASLLTVIWMALRIYETVLTIRAKRRVERHARLAGHDRQPELPRAGE